MPTSPQDAITIFFHVAPDNGQCFSPLEVFLWFLFMIAISCTWSLLFSSRDFRRTLGRGKITSNETSATKSRRFYISIAGSLGWNISMSVLTASFLTAGRSSAPLRYLLMGWFTRPLPALATLLVSAFDHASFRANIEELVLVESIYSVLPVYLFISIADQFKGFTARAKDYLSQDTHYRTGFDLLNEGIIINLLAWSALILVLGLVARSLMKRDSVTLWERDGRSITGGLVAISMLRFWGSGLIWSASVKLTPLNFCPTVLMNRNIMLLWAFVPLVDVLWRGYMGNRCLEDDR